MGLLVRIPLDRVARKLASLERGIMAGLKNVEALTTPVTKKHMTM